MFKLFVAAVLTGVLIVPASVMAESDKTDKSSDTKKESRAEREGSNKSDSGDDEDSDKEKDDSKAKKSESNTSVETGGVADSDNNKNAKLPGDIISLKNWYLTLPSGEKGKPDTIQPNELAGYSSEFMRLNDSKDGVVFTANAGGTTTKNSKYPRSELREMNGSEKASWDGNQGTHTMEIKQAVTKLPPEKPEVSIGQIHATSDDLMQIHLSGEKMTVKYDDGKKKAPIIDNYKLGDVFTVKIESADGHVKVWYNGELKADLPISSETSYFKAGNYLQTNTSKGDSADATSEVVIYGLDVKHQ